MEIRLILFKEIGFGISLNDLHDGLCRDRPLCLCLGNCRDCSYHLGRKNQENDFSFLK